MGKKRAAVVGGGLVGSLQAIFLAKRGWDVTVFERRGDIRKAQVVAGKSINLALSDRGWRALEMAGVADEIRKTAIPMHSRMIHFPDGRLMLQPYGKQNQAIYSVSRGGLNQQLLACADAYENIRLCFDHKCLDLDLDKNELTFENTATGQTVTERFDHIFGTDGAFSSVRARLQKTDRFDYSQEYLSHNYKELFIPAGPDGAHVLDPNALHIWPRGEYMMIALANPGGSFTVTLFMAHEGSPSFTELDTREKAAVFFETQFADAVPLMPTLLDDFFSNPSASLVMIKCAPWNISDRVMLLGDSAHAIVPFYGQGMNAGFEDCAEFDLALNAHGESPETFERFARERKPRTDAILELALRNYIEMRDKTADPRFILQKKIEARLAEKYPERWTPLYSLVTFSHTPYDEALAAGEAQDRFMDSVLALPETATDWETDAFIDRVAQMLPA